MTCFSPLPVPRPQEQIASLEAKYATLHTVPLAHSSVASHSNQGARAKRGVLGPRAAPSSGISPPPRDERYWWEHSRAKGVIHRAALTIQAARRAMLGRRRYREAEMWWRHTRPRRPAVEITKTPKS